MSLDIRTERWTVYGASKGGFLEKSTCEVACVLNSIMVTSRAIWDSISRFKVVNPIFIQIMFSGSINHSNIGLKYLPVICNDPPLSHIGNSRCHYNLDHLTGARFTCPLFKTSSTKATATFPHP